jgi:hypothetical protein
MKRTVIERETRGVRNCNPGNIRWSYHTTWKGEQGQDKDGFCDFKSPVYGIRAIFILLQNYYRYHDCRTLQSLIERWAPPGADNPTDEYVSFIASKCGRPVGAELLVSTHLMCIVRHIVQFENGYQPYSPEIYQQAYDMAYNL